MPEQPSGLAAQPTHSSHDALEQLGTMLLGEHPLPEVMHAVARLAALTVPGVDQASITLLDVDDKTRTVAFSGPLAVTLDERQYEAGFGPCLDAAQSGGVVRIPDTAREPLYRDFAAVARRAGVSSVVALGLPLPVHVLGALNLYRTGAAEPLDAESEAAAASFSVYAGVALANASLLANRERVVTHLQTAMRTRAVIDQAKGVIMSRTGCDPDTAFRRLAEQSQRSNRKVRDLAVDIVTAVTQGRPLDMI
jgi:GAF domain-containing protein